MRALRILSTAFGLALGVSACAVAALIDWARTEPIRVNYSFVGDDNASFATSIANRRGWELSRSGRA